MEIDKYLAPLFSGRTEKWLVTGAAGFIGSHIAEALLRHKQDVRILDNLSTGKEENIDYLKRIQSEYGGSLEFL